MSSTPSSRSFAQSFSPTSIWSRRVSDRIRRAGVGPQSPSAGSATHRVHTSGSPVVGSPGRAAATPPPRPPPALAGAVSPRVHLLHLIVSHLEAEGPIFAAAARSVRHAVLARYGEPPAPLRDADGGAVSLWDLVHDKLDEIYQREEEVMEKSIGEANSDEQLSAIADRQPRTAKEGPDSHALTARMRSATDSTGPQQHLSLARPTSGSQSLSLSRYKDSSRPATGHDNPLLDLDTSDSPEPWLNPQTPSGWPLMHGSAGVGPGVGMGLPGGDQGIRPGRRCILPVVTDAYLPMPKVAIEATRARLGIKDSAHPTSLQSSLFRQWPGAARLTRGVAEHPESPPKLAHLVEKQESDLKQGRSGALAMFVDQGGGRAAAETAPAGSEELQPSLSRVVVTAGTLSAIMQTVAFSVATTWQGHWSPEVARQFRRERRSRRRAFASSGARPRLHTATAAMAALSSGGGVGGVDLYSEEDDTDDDEDEEEEEHEDAAGMMGFYDDEGGGGGFMRDVSSRAGADREPLSGPPRWRLLNFTEFRSLFNPDVRAGRERDADPRDFVAPAGWSEPSTRNASTPTPDTWGGAAKSRARTDLSFADVVLLSLGQGGLARAGDAARTLVDWWTTTAHAWEAWMEQRRVDMDRGSSGGGAASPEPSPLPNRFRRAQQGLMDSPMAADSPAEYPPHVLWTRERDTMDDVLAVAVQVVALSVFWVRRHLFRLVARERHPALSLLIRLLRRIRSLLDRVRSNTVPYMPEDYLATAQCADPDIAPIQHPQELIPHKGKRSRSRSRSQSVAPSSAWNGHSRPSTGRHAAAMSGRWTQQHRTRPPRQMAQVSVGSPLAASDGVDDLADDYVHDDPAQSDSSAGSRSPQRFRFLPEDMPGSEGRVPDRSPPASTRGRAGERYQRQHQQQRRQGGAGDSGEPMKQRPVRSRVDRFVKGLRNCTHAAVSLLRRAMLVSERIGEAGPAALASGSGGAIVPAAGPWVAAPGEPDFNAWYDIPVQMLADQWTFLDWSLFAAIPVEEWLRGGFDDDRFKHTADAIRRCIDRYNASSLWVATEIVRSPTPRARASAYVRLVALALLLHRLHDFSGLSAVLSGLQNEAVTRMHQTMRLIPHEAASQVATLREIFAPSGLNAAYFDALAEVPRGEPVVPHLGPHHSRLTGVGAQIPDVYPGQESLPLLHLTKWRQLYHLVAPLAEFQERSYQGIIDAPVRSVCALLDSSLRPHAFTHPDDAAAAREALLRQSEALEPEEIVAGEFDQY